MSKESKVKECSVEGCDEPHHGKGFCRKHNDNNRRYGNPLGKVEEYYPNVGDEARVSKDFELGDLEDTDEKASIANDISEMLKIEEDADLLVDTQVILDDEFETEEQVQYIPSKEFEIIGDILSNPKVEVSKDTLDTIDNSTPDFVFNSTEGEPSKEEMEDDKNVEDALSNPVLALESYPKPDAETLALGQLELDTNISDEDLFIKGNEIIVKSQEDIKKNQFKIYLVLKLFNDRKIYTQVVDPETSSNYTTFKKFCWDFYNQDESYSYKQIKRVEKQSELIAVSDSAEETKAIENLTEGAVRFLRTEIEEDLIVPLWKATYNYAKEFAKTNPDGVPIIDTPLFKSTFNTMIENVRNKGITVEGEFIPDEKIEKVSEETGADKDVIRETLIKLSLGNDTEERLKRSKTYVQEFYDKPKENYLVKGLLQLRVETATGEEYYTVVNDEGETDIETILKAGAGKKVVLSLKVMS